MFSNTKLLVGFSIAVAIFGFSLLWFGLNLEPEKLPSLEVKRTQPATYYTPRQKIVYGQDGSGSRILGIDGEEAKVIEVVDGDTIKLEGGQRVRFIGIDTPETKDPRKSVQCFGKEASAKTKELLEGKTVILQKDVSETDKYSRILRYIFLPIDGGYLFVNDYLVREGYARALTYPPDVKYSQQFREAETQAKKASKGLWRKC